MTVHEIVEWAVAEGLLSPVGKTPAATMSSRPYRYVRDDPEPLIELNASWES
jgi:hypothetical protein